MLKSVMAQKNCEAGGGSSCVALKKNFHTFEAINLQNMDKNMCNLIPFNRLKASLKSQHLLLGLIKARPDMVSSNMCQTKG